MWQVSPATRSESISAAIPRGGHLAGIALVTDWQKDWACLADTAKGGICVSGMYDRKLVRFSARSIS
jgi:hypothetical protein